MSDVHQRYLDLLRRLQFAPPQRLASHQRGLLDRLVRHAYDNVPFYRERLACVLKGDRFAPEAWYKIPLMTRAEVQDHARELHAETVPAKVGPNVEGLTSGSSGVPLVFHRSHMAVIASECQWERMLEVHGIDRTAHYASIRIKRTATYPEGSELTGWNFTCPTSRVSQLHVGTPIAEQAEWLLRRAPQYLMTYPSNAAALAQRLVTIGAELRLSGVLTVGEQVNADQRGLIARVFSCSLFDNYGATEVGYLAFQCPAGGGYHVAHESTLIEVTDADGNAVLPGTSGVSSSPVSTIMLCHLFAMLLAITPSPPRALVVADAHCRALSALPGVNAMFLRSPTDRSNRPGAGAADFWPLLSAKQMQIVQTTIDMIEIRYVPRDEAPPPDLAQLNDAAHRYIHPAINVRAIAVDEIPRTPSGKVEDCISLVTPVLP